MSGGDNLELVCSGWNGFLVTFKKGILPGGGASVLPVGVRVDLLCIGPSLGDAARSQEALLVCFRPNLLWDGSVMQHK